jgi:hypothetical protein
MLLAFRKNRLFQLKVVYHSVSSEMAKWGLVADLEENGRVLYSPDVLSSDSSTFSSETKINVSGCLGK